MALELDQVIALYGPGLERTAASYERDLGLRQDLLHDIYVSLATALPRLRDPDRARAYVFRVAHHRCVSHVIKRVRNLEDMNDIVEVGAADAAQENRLMASERTSALVAAVRRLPLPYRQVVTLLLEELTYREIADVLGISLSNVGVRVSRAKRQLKEMLGDD